MDKILITGATGFIGKNLVKELFCRGYSLVILTRNIASAKEKIPLPLEFITWDDLEKSNEKNIKGVIHLAGENIAMARWSKKQKKIIYNSRIKNTQKLVNFFATTSETPQKNPLNFFCAASAIGYYSNSDCSQDENSPAAKTYLANVCIAWEKEIKKINAKRIIIARLGTVLDSDGGALRKLLPFYLLGLGGKIGNGKMWMSWIAKKDVVNFFLQVTKKYNGIYNLTTPNPICNKDFHKSLAKTLKIPNFFFIPKFALKIGLGEMSQIILNSQKIIPKNLVRQEYKFCYPEIKETLESACHFFQGKPHFLFQNYQYLPLPLEKVFAFFKNIENLALLTPQNLKFQFIKASSNETKKNTQIEYKIRIFAFSIKQKSIIQDFKNKEYFSDLQLKGLFASWYHQHFFYSIEKEGKKGVLLEDKVFYRPPFLPFSLLGYGIIKKKIQEVFTYRNQALKKTLLF